MGSDGQSPTPSPPAMPSRPPNVPPPDSRHPPTWSWWVVGIVIPMLAILATLLVRPSATDPSSASASTGSPSGNPESQKPVTTTPSSPSVSPVPRESSTLKAPAGYTLRKLAWGISAGDCKSHQQQIVDLDTGTSRFTTTAPAALGTVPASDRSSELIYYSRPDVLCGFSAILRAAAGGTVGLLPSGSPKTFTSCRDAAGTGFGPLELDEVDRRESRGFIKGAAVCSVTQNGAVAMAVIDGISQEDLPAVRGDLFVWSKNA